MKMVGNLFVAFVRSAASCLCKCELRAIDRRQRENAGLPASVDRSTFDIVWMRLVARALQTTWFEHISCFPWLQCAMPLPRHTAATTSIWFFFRNAFTIPAKRFPLPLSLGSSCGMHFSVMKMAQRTESRKATQAEDERKRDLKMCETSEWKEKKREITEIATANRKEWIGRCKFSHHIPCTHDARRIPYLPRPSRFESHKLPVGYNVSLAQPLDALSHSHTFVVVGGAAAAREIIIETVLDITLAPTVASTHISTEAPWLIAVVAHTHTHTFVHSSRWNRRKKKQFMRFCEYQRFM